jgi:hypothetical protein
MAPPPSTAPQPAYPAYPVYQGQDRNDWAWRERERRQWERQRELVIAPRTCAIASNGSARWSATALSNSDQQRMQDQQRREWDRQQSQNRRDQDQMRRQQEREQQQQSQQRERDRMQAERDRQQQARDRQQDRERERDQRQQQAFLLAVTGADRMLRHGTASAFPAATS